MIRVFLDQSPLSTGHNDRGIGAYTRGLASALEQLDDVQIIEDQNEPHDIIHYPYFDLFQASLPLWKSKPTVVTIHDVIPLEFPQQYRPGKKGSVAYRYQKLALKSVKAILTDSQYSKDQIHQRLKLPDKKIWVTPLAAADRFKPAKPAAVQEVRTKYELPAQYILYVGDINYNKNIPQLIKAVKFLPESLSLVLVGKNFRPQSIPEWRWIETQLELSSVTDRVVFLPTVESQEDLAAVYSGAEVYVQPSLSEGFGLPVLEAMSCHCPVVTTRAGSLPEVGGEHAEYCEPEAESIANAVMLVLEWSGATRKKYIEAAADWSKTFTWKKTAEETRAVYKHALKLS